MAQRKTSAADDQRRLGVSMTPAEEAQLRGEVTPPTTVEPAVPSSEPVPAQPDGPTGSAPASERPAERSGMVPIAALHEERERRKDLQRQVETLSQRTDQRLRMIAEKLSGAAPQPADTPRAIPDPEKDALGAIKMTAEEVKVLGDFRRRLEGQAQAQTLVNRMMATASRLEDEFKKTAPDYSAAADFIKQHRAAELEALGVDPFRAKQIVASEGVQLVHAALQSGRNPAHVVYTLAKSRGYAAPQAHGGAPASGRGQAGAEHLQRISRGQDAGASLGSASGAAPGKTGIEALLAMSDGEFAQALDKMTPAQLRQHFGN